MFPPKMPKMRNNKSQALLVPLALAFLTIKMVTRVMINMTIATDIAPQETPPRCNAGMTLTPPKIPKTIMIIKKMARIQEKKLAMLYIKYESLCITIKLLSAKYISTFIF